jgi:large subunit ribosomal protein L24
MIKTKIKKGDKVVVISGDHKGAQGIVLKMLRSQGKAIVEGVNIVARHTKPNPKNPDGGIIKKEAPLPLCKLMLIDPKGRPTRVGRVLDEKTGKLVRYSKKEKKESNQILIIK